MEWGRSTTGMLLLTAVLGGGCAAPVAVQVQGTLPDDHPRVYVVGRAPQPLKIDGKLDEPIWLQAPRTDLYIDIEGDRKPRPEFDTRSAMLWDDEYFYFGCWMDEPHLWGTLTERDSIIYRDNDWEIFVDPDRDNVDYDEFEINVLGTEFDLRLTRGYRCGGTFDIPWDMVGLKTGIHVEGTINDPSDQDSGWTVEVAIPWSSFADVSNVPCPPGPGDIWAANFSRVQWPLEIVDGAYVKPEGVKEDNWVWTPQDAIDMHRPEYWGSVQFVDAPPGTRPFVPDDQVVPRTILRRLQTAIEQYIETEGEPPTSWADLEGRWMPVPDSRVILKDIGPKGDSWFVTMQQLTDPGEGVHWQLGPNCRLTREAVIVYE
ncbi:MAG: carbohydrate-binding family 9-like protein [Phycisphaerales bacterium]|nr:carbohydrate-binding family 9-like protein [Phycisphaerales bacterium]